MPSYLLPFTEESTQTQAFNLLERLEETPSHEALLIELSECTNLFRQTQILQLLIASSSLNQQVTLAGNALPTSLAKLVEEVYQRACEKSLWAIVRTTAGLLNKSHYGLADAVTELIVRQKQVIVGRSYSTEGTIVSSESNHSIVTRIDKCCGKDAREEMIHQEVLLFLSYAVKSDPKIFKNMISIRTNEFIHLTVTQIASEREITHGEAFDHLASMSPQAIQQRLKNVISSYKETQAEMLSLEALKASETSFNEAQLEPNNQFETRVADWTAWRLQFGALNRMPDNFYDQVRSLLDHCQGIVLGDKFNSSNQIDSSLVLGSMTAGEPAFALLIEGLLNDIPAPDYRHLTLEALLALSAFCKANPDLLIENYLVIDVIIGHAVRLNWIARNPAQAQNYAERKAAAWKTFYQSSPQRVAQSTIKALEFLLAQA
jgi:phosphorylase kinase alpha/beta subunit